MRQIGLFILMFVSIHVANGQVKTGKLTAYKQFKPSIIQLSDGRQLKQSLTNIFLKNSSLLYLRGSQSMEANMDNIVSVKFDDRFYVKIDSVLAYQVDTVGNDALYKATVIDMKAYYQQLRNNQIITNLSLGDQISTTTIDVSSDDDYLFPLIDLFYYRFNGKFVLAHERNFGRLLNKEQKRIMRSHMSLPDFSWTKEESLFRLLKALQ